MNRQINPAVFLGAQLILFQDKPSRYSLYFGAATIGAKIQVLVSQGNKNA